MTAPLNALLTAVRKACLPGPWSQGVKLAREGAAFGQVTRGDSILVRVRAVGTAVAPTVTLYPADLEWGCDCGAPVDPCAHVAAAVIALGQAGGVGHEVPAPEEAAARLRYRFERKDGALSLKRYVVRADGREELVRASIATPAGRGALQPTHEDLAVDRAVGSRQPGYFPPERMGEIFGALASGADVWLEDAPIKTSSEPIGPRAVVQDHEGGVMLVIDRDPRVLDIVVAGIARIGDTLHPLVEVELTGGRLERLPLRRRFSAGEMGTLVTEVLPGLDKRMPVEIKSRRLPQAGGRSRPRIQIDLGQREHTLSVTASLVYGDPAEARIDDGRLVHLGGRVPVRDEAAERELLGKLRDELHLVPGRRVDFDGSDAIRFAQRLSAWRGGGAEGARRELFGKGKLVPRLRIDDEAFDVSFDLEAEGDEEAKGRAANADAVIRAWQDGLPLVPLQGGGWAPLPSDWLERYGARVADLLAARRDDGKLEKAALPALADLCDALEHPKPAGFDRLAPLIEGFESIPEGPLPEGLTATLRPYQEGRE